MIISKLQYRDACHSWVVSAILPLLAYLILFNITSMTTHDKLDIIYWSLVNILS